MSYRLEIWYVVLNCDKDVTQNFTLKYVLLLAVFNRFFDRFLAIFSFTD
jgi:hypothetical protein